MQWIELENKYSYSYLPYDELKFLRKYVIYRKYISTNPEIRLHMRCFESNERRYHLVIKNEVNLEANEVLLSRRKIKFSISENDFLSAFNAIPHYPLVIDVYDFKYDDDHVIGFKNVRGLDISFAEIEYRSIDDMLNLKQSVDELSFFVKNVTDDVSYKMSNIWKKYLIINKM